MKNENKVMNNRVIYGVCIISFWWVPIFLAEFKIPWTLLDA